jgi:hypothetical protein
LAHPAARRTLTQLYRPPASTFSTATATDSGRT